MVAVDSLIEVMSTVNGMFHSVRLYLWDAGGQFSQRLHLTAKPVQRPPSLAPGALPVATAVCPSSGGTTCAYRQLSPAGRRMWLLLLRRTLPAICWSKR